MPLGIVRTSGTGKDASIAGEMMHGGARGVVSVEDATAEEVFDDIMRGDGGSEEADFCSRRSLFSWWYREKGWELYGLGKVS